MYDNTLLNAVIEVIEGCSNTKKNLCISATGAHGLVTAYNDVKFKEVLDHFFINLPDGIEVIEGCSNTKKNLCISATGAHGLVTAYNDVKFKEVLDHFFINLPDG